MKVCYQKVLKNLKNLNQIYFAQFNNSQRINNQNQKENKKVRILKRKKFNPNQVNGDFNKINITKEVVRVKVQKLFMFVQFLMILTLS